MENSPPVPRGAPPQPHVSLGWGTAVAAMPNGCLCCSAKGQVVSVLEAIAQKKAVEHVIIETSGVALTGQSGPPHPPNCREAGFLTERHPSRHH